MITEKGQQDPGIPGAKSPAAGQRSESRVRWPGLTFAVSERRLLLFIGDAILINVALLLGIGLAPRAGVPLSFSTVLAHPIWFIVLTGLWWLVATVLEA